MALPTRTRSGGAHTKLTTSSLQMILALDVASLVTVARRQPTEISVFLRVLRLISRTTSNAATAIQRMVRSRAATRNNAIIRIQHVARRRRYKKRADAVGRIVRAWRCHAKQALKTASAAVIQCFVRRRRARIHLRHLRLFGEVLEDVDGALGLDTVLPTVQETAAVRPEQPSAGVASIWNVAKELGFFYPNAEAVPNFSRNSCRNNVSGAFCWACVAMMTEVSPARVGPDTRMICHCLVHHYLWAIVIASSSPTFRLASSTTFSRLASIISGRRTGVRFEAQ